MSNPTPTATSANSTYANGSHLAAHDLELERQASLSDEANPARTPSNSYSQQMRRPLVQVDVEDGEGGGKAERVAAVAAAAAAASKAEVLASALEPEQLMVLAGHGGSGPKGEVSSQDLLQRADDIVAEVPSPAPFHCFLGPLLGLLGTLGGIPVVLFGCLGSVVLRVPGMLWKILARILSSPKATVGVKVFLLVVTFLSIPLALLCAILFGVFAGTVIGFCAGALFYASYAHVVWASVRLFDVYLRFALVRAVELLDPDPQSTSTATSSDLEAASRSAGEADESEEHLEPEPVYACHPILAVVVIVYAVGIGIPVGCLAYTVVAVLRMPSNCYRLVGVLLHSIRSVPACCCCGFFAILLSPVLNLLWVLTNSVLGIIDGFRICMSAYGLAKENGMFGIPASLVALRNAIQRRWTFGLVAIHLHDRERRREKRVQRQLSRMQSQVHP